jgi:hypothetical protein
LRCGSGRRDVKKHPTTFWFFCIILAKERPIHGPGLDECDG